MKINKTLIQLILIVLTLSIIAIIVWGVRKEIFLNHNEIQKKMMDGIMDKK